MASTVRICEYGLVPNDRRDLVLGYWFGFRIIEAEGRDMQVCFAGMRQ
jgi:hypothetical protein